MAELNLDKFPILFFAFIHASAASSPVFEIKNYIEKCVSVSLLKPLVIKKNAFVDVNLTILNSIGDCGCTSMMASYVLEDSSGKEIHYRRFALHETHQERFYAGKSATSVEKQTYQARLNCAGPL